MDDEMRWAARFAFLEELWQGRARLVVDRGLERFLGTAMTAEDPDHEPLRELVDRLLPASRGPRSWMATHEPATARELARTRPATGFVGIDMLGEIIDHREWTVALVDLAELVLERSSERDDDGIRRLPPLATRLVAKLGEAARAGRTVALVLPAAVAGDRGFDEVDATELLSHGLGGGRMFGIYRPPMAGIVDFGRGEAPAAGDEDDEAAGDEGEEGDDDTASIESDDDVPLSFDNTLGTQEPMVAEWLLVAGPAALPEGLTLLELPPTAAADPLPATLRAQLQQAQRHADLGAIETHALVERIDELSRDNEALRARVAELQDELARAVHAVHTEAAEGTPTVAGDDAARLEEAAAQAQTLRWRIAELQQQLEAARARPVDALEAEVASLTARLQAASDTSSTSAATTGATMRPPAATRNEMRPPAAVGEHDGAAVRGWVDAQIRALLVRIERGGLANVQLRNALLQLRTHLRRAAARPD